MILGLDPSFTGTGCCLADDNGNIIRTKKISFKGVTYKSIVDNHKTCLKIIKEIDEFIGNEHVDVICEYPALATRSGAYLAILNGFLAHWLTNSDKVISVTWIPPVACNSFVGNKLKNKSFLVDWCKERELIRKRTSHDECTAIIFVMMYREIRIGKYKNSYFTWKR